MYIIIALTSRQEANINGFHLEKLSVLVVEFAIAAFNHLYR